MKTPVEPVGSEGTQQSDSKTMPPEHPTDDNMEVDPQGRYFRIFCMYISTSVFLCNTFSKMQMLRMLEMVAIFANF